MQNETITKEGFISSFIEWVRANEARLVADNITIRLPEKILAEGTYAEFFAASGEATVEMWDYGFSEFHVWMHHGNPKQEEVKTTHYEFQDFDEMYIALNLLINRLSPILALV
ncbi:MAG: hypothetical protein ACRYFS_00250 [Janthinobacterium lividum]